MTEHTITVTRGEPPFDGATTDLPDKVVVDQHGHYWRSYPNHYSMPPVSDENTETEVIAVYVRQRALPEGMESIGAMAERALTPTGDHHVIPGGYCLDCSGQHIGEWLEGARHPTLPPPDPALMDVLTEKAHPDQPVRLEGPHPAGPWTGDPADYDGDEGR